MWVFIGLAGSVIAHFPTGGHSVRHPHKVELSVSDRKSLLVDGQPCLPLGDGVWGFWPFLSRVLGGLTYTTKKPIPINMLWMSLFLGWTPGVWVLRG